MPHDVDGKELEVGQVVVIQCVVKKIFPGAEHCDVELESVHERKGDYGKLTLTCDAAVVQKVYETEEEAEAAADPTDCREPEAAE